MVSVVEPSSKVAGTHHHPLGLQGYQVKLGVPVCVLPWISVDVAGSAVGTTGGSSV